LLSIIDLCHTLPVLEFEPGAVLLAEGETTGALYVLIDGGVEIVKGEVRVQIVSDPGAIFGEISALLNVPNIATVRAITLSSAHMIAGGAAFLQTHPEVANSLLKLFAQRLYGLTHYMGDVKRQFENHDNHLAMVHDVVETLIHHPGRSFTAGSDRDSGV
jgi:CRP/FNR family transcriptional regulator, cyclic AMP receptor protein